MDILIGKAISCNFTCLLQPDTHLNFDLLWSAVLARQSIMVLLLSEEVPGCSCVSLAKRGCLKAIMSTSTRLLRLPDWRRTWQGHKSQLKTLEGCVWLLHGQKMMADFILWTTDWINWGGKSRKFIQWISNLFAKLLILPCFALRWRKSIALFFSSSIHKEMHRSDLKLLFLILHKKRDMNVFLRLTFKICFCLRTVSSQTDWVLFKGITGWTEYHAAEPWSLQLEEI